MIFGRSDFLPNVPARRLVVVSDFAQHSEVHSMYGQGRSLEPPAELADEFFQDMSGVDIRLQYVRRANLRGLQGRSHRNFWEAYVDEQKPKSMVLGHGLLIGEDPRRPTYQYRSPGMAALGEP